jgi:hypothetical protein
MVALKVSQTVVSMDELMVVLSVASMVASTVALKVASTVALKVASMVYLMAVKTAAEMVD